ncbi:MAG: SCO family protein [Acidobacteriota bacterium]
MKTIFWIFFLALSFPSCQRSADLNVSPDAKRFPFKGKVISVNKEAKKAKIEHGDIPGYMEAMTMEFPIREDWVWDELKPGADIEADLVVDDPNAQYWLEKIRISMTPNPNQAALPVNEDFAQIGKDVPNFELTNQNGKRISLKDFRGKALAITFIYRECPLPDYCIRMSKNFSDLAMRLNTDPDLSGRIALLSISFDPARDTPDKLKQYGLGYMGQGAKELGVWQLAVGTDKQVRGIADFFGLRFEVDQNDKAQINHSLRTAVIGPDGKVTKIFPGNEWTSDDLLRELSAALSRLRP